MHELGQSAVVFCVHLLSVNCTILRSSVQGQIESEFLKETPNVGIGSDWYSDWLGRRDMDVYPVDQRQTHFRPVCEAAA